MLEIKEYNDKYASALSRIILDNLYTINIKDHGKEVIDKLSLKFSEEEIKKTFPRRTKCFVAVEEDVVLGTASVDRLWGDDTGLKYIVLTVFVSLEAHGNVRSFPRSGRPFPTSVLGRPASENLYRKSFGYQS